MWDVAITQEEAKAAFEADATATPEADVQTEEDHEAEEEERRKSLKGALGSSKSAKAASSARMMQVDERPASGARSQHRSSNKSSLQA